MISSLLLAASLVAQSAPLVAQDERNAWYTTLDDALAEAKRTNRPLLVQSAAPACHGVPGLW